MKKFYDKFFEISHSLNLVSKMTDSEFDNLSEAMKSSIKKHIQARSSSKKEKEEARKIEKRGNAKKSNH